MKKFYLKFSKNLRSSNKTLEKVVIQGKLKRTKIENCNSLFEFIEKCEKLTTIDLKIKINDDKIPDLLKKLKNFNIIYKN